MIVRYLNQHVDLPIWFLAVLVIFVYVAIAWIWVTQKKQRVWRLELQAMQQRFGNQPAPCFEQVYLNERYPFENTSTLSARCPRCGEDNLQPTPFTLLAHLETCQQSLRFEWLAPEEFYELFPDDENST